MSAATPEFSGLKGRLAAWFLTSPLRRVLEWKMGKPDERVIELLALTGGERVLDAGCGSGFHTLMVAERLTTGRVTAIDVSTEMLDRLRSLAAARGLTSRVDAAVGDNLALDYASDTMDRAVSVAVWHHLSDPQRACAELARTLKPGGLAVVVDLAIAPSSKAVSGLKGHDRAFGPDDMRRIMERAALVNVSVETLGRWVIGVGHKPTAGGTSAGFPAP